MSFTQALKLILTALVIQYKPLSNKSKEVKR